MQTVFYIDDNNKLSKIHRPAVTVPAHLTRVPQSVILQGDLEKGRSEPIPVNQWLLRIAYRAAELYSEDPRTQIGAVIYRPETGTPISLGYNAFPPGVTVTEAMRSTDAKYEAIIHAEEMAIFRAAAEGKATAGATMVCPWACCGRCARAIIAAGITKLVVHAQAHHRGPGHWLRRIEEGWAKLRDSSVELVTFSGRVGTVNNLLGGEKWEP